MSNETEKPAPETKKPRLIRGWMNVYESPKGSGQPPYGGFIWPNKKQATEIAEVGEGTPTRISTIFVDSRTATHPDIATRVSVWGMYDNHTFHPIKGKTVDEVIENWRAHNEDPPSRGPSTLCPITVINADGRELRRVGGMVGPDRDTETYRDLVLADPDIPRLLVLQGL